MSGLDFAGVISEFITLIGLFFGAIVYLAGLSIRGISGRWVRTDAVICAALPTSVIRWYDHFGDVHESAADTHETAHLDPGEDVLVWFRRRSPERCRTHDPALDGKPLRVTGLILLGIGAAAAVAGIVIMFL
ncbi:MAG: sortase [Cryobacterium sp.]